MFANGSCTQLESSCNSWADTRNNFPKRGKGSGLEFGTTETLDRKLNLGHFENSHLLFVCQYGSSNTGIPLKGKIQENYLLVLKNGSVS